MTEMLNDKCLKHNLTQNWNCDCALNGHNLNLNEVVNSFPLKTGRSSKILL